MRHADTSTELGWVSFRLSRTLGGTIRNATVSRDGTGWHIAFGAHTGRTPGAPNSKPGCGVDFGVATSAYVSTETEPRVMAPTLTKVEVTRLKYLEQQKGRQVAYAKKHNGGMYSKRLRATIAQIARIKARQSNRRAEFTHNLTTDPAKNHGFVGIEDLTFAASGQQREPPHPAVRDRQFWIYEQGQGVIDIPTNRGASPGSTRPTQH